MPLLQEKIDSLLAKNAIEFVPQEDKHCGFYSQLFLVPKRTDLSSVTFQDGNMAVWDPLHEARGLAGFHRSEGRLPPHIPIRPSYRQYLRFEFQGVFYQFQFLPFGLNIAPMVWTTVLVPIMEILHLQGIYISPFITKAAERRDLSKALDHSTDVLLNAGFLINVKKSEIVPTLCVRLCVCRQPIPYRPWNSYFVRRPLSCSSKSVGTIPKSLNGRGTCIPATTRHHG